MVNSKKSSKSIIALVVMALLLVASIVLGATGAWFTSKVSIAEDTLNFGNIEITASATDLVSAVRGVDGTDDTVNLMPGDKLTVSFSVANAADSDAAWVGAYVKVTATGGTGDLTAINNLTGLYGFDGQKLATDKLASLAAGDTAAKNVKVELELDGATYTDAYEKAVVKVEVVVYAIQKANLTEADAYALINNAATGASGAYDFEAVV